VAYVGRFAPSPSGALHLGSLTTAAASFLDARHHSGRWLLRIEDLDAPRVIPGAADTIVRTLENLGFSWDGPVIHQSQRLPLYQQALEELGRHGQTYSCSCSRRDRGGSDDAGGYAGTCRQGPTRPGPVATRFRADLNPAPDFTDRLQGLCGPGRAAAGDPILRRRDGLDGIRRPSPAPPRIAQRETQHRVRRLLRQRFHRYPILLR